MNKYSNITKLNRWWRSHREYGGGVYKVYMDWKEITHPEKYVDNLFKQYKALSFEDILAFSESEVTDNSMPNRDIMEDASKIHMLRHAIRNKEMLFRPQVLHEPWYDRYRVHPGSGRAAALWLEGYDGLPGLYIHFNERCFTPPKDAYELLTVPEIQANIIFQKHAEPDFESYDAFPKQKSTCIKTQDMDSEWHWHYIKTYRPWRFLRWSEGNNFLKHKYNWRTYAVDLWHELN